MNKILLNDNTELEIERCGASEGVLWTVLPGLTMLEAMTIFSDTSKTSKIIAYNDFEYLGYTELIHISIDYDGAIKVALRQEV